MLKKCFLFSVVVVLILFSLFTFLINHEAAASAIVTYVIDASKDDAWSKTSDVKWDDAQYYLSRVDMRAGCRWHVNIPKGASILNAYFVCRAKNDSDSTNMFVRIEVFDQDSCKDFDEIFWNWPVMELNVSWQLPSFYQGLWYSSPDIKSLVQAFIDRPGYQTGNYIGLKITRRTGFSGGHEIWSWDGDPNSAAKLEITYMVPPIADFLWTPPNPIMGETVTLNASSSYSASASIVQYRWNFGDGSPDVNGITPITTHVYAAIGSYNVTLLIIDSDGLTNSTTRTVYVRESGDPVAAFTYSPQNPIVNQLIIFNASTSYDTDGTITDYEWNFGDGTNDTGMIVVHSYSSNGFYTVILNVTDNDGKNNYKSEFLVVGKHPIAAFEYSPSAPTAEETITFNASASSPEGGYIVTYSWNFGDDMSVVETDPVTSHAYSTHGIYNVSLEVTDSEGLTNESTMQIIVYASPIASFVFSPAYPTPNNSVLFNATGSYDLDGYVVNYTWNFGDGNVTTVNSTVITHVYSESGDQTVTLTVVDNDGFSNSTLQIIGVYTHDVAIINVSVSNTEAHIGQIINITVLVRNKGTATESFNVSVYRNETLVATELVSALLPSGEKTLVFSLNTSTMLSDAAYLIEARADLVNGENEVADNTYVSGIVRVLGAEDGEVSPPFNLTWILIGVPILALFFTGVIWKKRKKAGRESKGFEFFDQITGGGIPDSFSVLIKGSVGSGKSALCQQLVVKFLNADKPCAYVTYDCFPNEVRENMKRFNWDTSKSENEGKFVFVDCFSSIAAVPSKEKYCLTQPFSLSELGIVMSKVTSESDNAIKVIFDSVVPLLTHVEPQKVVEFLQDRSARIKGVNGTFIFTSGKETIESNLVSRLEEVVDCIIELDMNASQGETTRRLRIKKMRGRKTSDEWIRFEIDPSKGISFPI